MTKRASGKFKRNARDLYQTPESAVVPLIPYLEEIDCFAEPCCGKGLLVKHLHNLTDLRCVWQSDIHRYDKLHEMRDARDHQYNISRTSFITNPIWQRQAVGPDGKRLPSDQQPLHMIIANLSAQAPTWLLLDADWMHTKQATPYQEYCTDIVSVGRVSWMGNNVSGFDNCCWYHFDQGQDGPPLFHPRT